MILSSRQIFLRSLWGKNRNEHQLTMPQGVLNHIIKKSCKTNSDDISISNQSATTLAYNFISKAERHDLWTPAKQNNQASMTCIVPEHTTTIASDTCVTSNVATAIAQKSVNTPLPIITTPAPNEFTNANVTKPTSLTTTNIISPSALINDTQSIVPSMPSAPLNTEPNASPSVTLEPIALTSALNKPVIATSNILNPTLNPIATVSNVTLHHKYKHENNANYNKDKDMWRWTEHNFRQRLSKKQVVQALFMPFTQPLEELAPMLREQLDIDHVALHQRQIFANRFLPTPDCERQKRAKQWAWLAQQGFFVHNEDPANSNACFMLMSNNKHLNSDNKSIEITCSQQLGDSTNIEKMTTNKVNNNLSSVEPISTDSTDDFVSLAAKLFIPQKVTSTKINFCANLNKFNNRPKYLHSILQPTVTSICINNRKYNLNKNPKNFKDLKSNFAFLRHRLYLRQTELSNYLHCPQSTIAKWESPFYETWFPDHLLPVIAQLFHCAPCFLDRSNFDFSAKTKHIKHKIVQPRSCNNSVMFNSNIAINLYRKPISSIQISNNLNFIMCYRNRSWTQLYQNTGFNYDMMNFWRHSKLLQMDSSICWRLATYLNCPMQLLTFYRKRSLPHFVWVK